MEPTLVQLLLPNPVLALVLAMLGAVAGPYLARFAARRTVTQPLALALPAEVSVLTGVLAKPSRLPYLTSLSSADFAVGAHSRIWAVLLECAPECAGLPEDAAEELYEARGQLLQARKDVFLGDVRQALRCGIAPEGDTARLDELLRGGDGDDVQLLDAGQSVLWAGQDRNRLAGIGLVLPTSTPDSVDPQDPPVARVHVKPTMLRTSLSAAATGLGAFFIPALVANTGYEGLAAWFAAASLVALLTLSVVISLVDIDTFTIDLPTFAGTALGAWLFAFLAAAVSGTWGRLLTGTLLVLGVAAVFEGGNRLYRLVRGSDGQGFGDTLIILATAGVPPALTGEWTLGYYSVMAGMVVGVLGWLVGALSGRLGRHSPFAFGPYLSAGWIVGWVVFATNVAPLR